MPGVPRTDMNGYRDFEQGHLRTSSYANGYDPYRRDREDMMYREGGYGRSPRHNGLADDFGEQNSFEVMRDGNEPSYEVDHLATYTSKSGTTHPEDGLVKLKQMESSTGIWTMRCLLIVERRHITVIDKANGDELERFPLSQIFEPTAVLKNDRRETYNNLLLFTVVDDPRRKGSSSDMHIFQCINSAAHDVVDEVLSAKGEGAAPRRGANDKPIPPPPSGPAPEPPYGKFANYKPTQRFPDRFSEPPPSEMRLGESRRPDSPRFGEPKYAVSRHSESGQFGESKFGESGRLGDSKFGISRHSEAGGFDEPKFGESRRLGESKSGENRLAESSRFAESNFRESRFGESGLAGTRLGDTTQQGDSRLEESNRFKDASQWINTSYAASNQGRDLPASSSVRSVRSVGYPGIPDYTDYQLGNYYQTSTPGNSKPKGGYSFGTWSGREAGKAKHAGRKPGKKGRKWYKFGFSKDIVKSNYGKENKGYHGDADFSSSTLPHTKSYNNDDYASVSRRRIKSDGDAGDAIDGLNYAGRYGGAGGAGGASRDYRVTYIQREELDTGQNEALERDVQLLNNCFDDIEKFVSRLQQAAEAYKELERRRYDRGHKNRRKIAGDGMLTMRARPPPGDDFVDIFQKFKFAFNLLAKLKAHIHDPNAPELVHFLFTPLSLIYEASRDPIHGGRDLAGEAISPLLVIEAKQLLLNCLTSKELELWQHLGKPWTLSKDDWKGYVNPYNPKFYNGRQPSPQVIEEINRPGPSDRFRGDRIREPAPDKYAPQDEDRYRRDPYSREFRGDDIRPPSPPTAAYQEYVDRQIDSEFAPIWNKRGNTSREAISAPRTRAEENYQFGQELKQMGATIYEVVHERSGKNQKELTVEKGDIVQVLDKSRNWWKLKKYSGETGFAPYTILKEHQPQDDYDNGGGRRISGDYSSYINGNQQAPPPAPPPMSGANRAQRGDEGHNSPSVSPRSREAPPVLPRPKHEPVVYRKPDHAEELNNELRLRMNTSMDSGSSPRSPRWQRKAVTLTQHSIADDVTEWLTMKGFSRRCTELLSGYHGIDLFGLERQELERLLGREEGRHLDSLLTVQKNNAGFMSSSGASELNVILKRRKERADTRSTDESIGRLPAFQPETPPDYSPAGSDTSSVEDYGDAGKTLRNLLERQRKKIQSGQYQHYN